MFEAAKRWEVRRRNVGDEDGVYYMSDNVVGLDTGRGIEKPDVRLI